MADWKSLTDGEWVNIVNSDAVKDEGSYVHGAVCAAFKLIEAKLREKNEPKTALDYFIEDVEAAQAKPEPKPTSLTDAIHALDIHNRSAKQMAVRIAQNPKPLIEALRGLS